MNIPKKISFRWGATALALSVLVVATATPPIAAAKISSDQAIPVTSIENHIEPNFWADAHRAAIEGGVAGAVGGAVGGGVSCGFGGAAVGGAVGGFAGAVGGFASYAVSNAVYGGSGGGGNCTPGDTTCKPR